MEPDLLVEWCSQWFSLVDEFDGRFSYDRDRLRDYIRQILPKGQTYRGPPTDRADNFLYSLETEVSCSPGAAGWDPDAYRLEMKLESDGRSAQVHSRDLVLGKSLTFELTDPSSRMTLVLRRKWRLHELTKAPSELIRKLLPERASRALLDTSDTSFAGRILFQGFLSDLSSRLEVAQQAEIIIVDEVTGSGSVLQTTLRLIRKPSPETLAAHREMAKYLAAFRKSRVGYPLMDSEGAVLLKLHAHRHRIPRTKRAHIYLEVAIEAKRKGIHVPYAYLRQNLRALDNEHIPKDTNEGLLYLSKAALLEGICHWNRLEDEEAISCVVCYFEAARRINAVGTSTVKTLLSEVSAKLCDIFGLGTTATPGSVRSIEAVDELSSNLSSLACWIQVLDRVCPKYGEEKFSLLLENVLRDFVLPHARAVVTATLEESINRPGLALKLSSMLQPLARLCQLTVDGEDFSAWFSDEQARDLIQALVSAERKNLLAEAGALSEGSQDFAEKLREHLKRCERLVDMFMWRHIELVTVFCKEICNSLHALRARLWFVHKNSSMDDLCVRINALRELDFACDEVKAFLRLGPTGLNAEFEVALRDVQIKVASSQNALILRLAAQMLGSDDVRPPVHDMVDHLQETAEIAFEVNAHDRQKLVACLWKIFLVTVMKRQQDRESGHGDRVELDASVSTAVGNFVEKLLEICPHLRPDDLKVN